MYTSGGRLREGGLGCMYVKCREVEGRTGCMCVNARRLREGGQGMALRKAGKTCQINLWPSLRAITLTEKKTPVSLYCCQETVSRCILHMHR